MRRKVCVVAVVILLSVSLITATPAQQTTSRPNQPTSSVKNKTYDVQVSIGSAAGTPFHDCARFSRTQMCLDACAAPQLRAIPRGNRG
jgi:hypothetical protein